MKPLSGERGEQLTKLAIELLGGGEGAVLEVRAEVDAHLLLGDRRTKGSNDLTQVAESSNPAVPE